MCKGFSHLRGNRSSAPENLKSDATGVFETTKLLFCVLHSVMRSMGISSSLHSSHLPSPCIQWQLTKKLNTGQNP